MILDENSANNKELETPQARLASPQIGAMVSALSGLLVLAYIMGWSYTQAYFSEIGAPWLLDIVPTRLILTNSAFPIMTLWGAFVFMLIDLPKAFWTPKGLTVMTNGLFIIAMAFTALTVAPSLREMMGPWLARLVVLPAGFAYAFFVVALLKEATSRFGDDGFNIKSTLRLAPLVFVLGLYLVPAMFGRSEALAAINPNTFLPLVVARGPGGSSQTLRLLLATEDKIYAIETKSQITRNVFAIPWANVVSVQLRNPL